MVVVFKCTKSTFTCKLKSHTHREGVMLMDKMVCCVISFSTCGFWNDSMLCLGEFLRLDGPPV